MLIGQLTDQTSIKSLQKSYGSRKAYYNQITRRPKMVIDYLFVASSLVVKIVIFLYECNFCPKRVCTICVDIDSFLQLMRMRSFRILENKTRRSEDYAKCHGLGLPFLRLSTIMSMKSKFRPVITEHLAHESSFTANEGINNASSYVMDTTCNATVDSHFGEACRWKNISAK